MALFILTLSLIFGSACFALRWGDSPEKSAAIVMLVMVIVSFSGNILNGYHYVKIDPVGVLSDLSGLAGFVAIALFARRIWPLWASSLQLIAFAAHLTRALEVYIHPTAYAIMRWGPSDLIPVLLIAGTINCIRRKRRGDNSRPWRNWSERSNQNELID